MKNSPDIPLDGVWQMALGDLLPIEFPQSVNLPGSLQMQGFGNDVTVETPWTGQIIDRSWFTEERFAPYRQPENIKIPFWLQPEKHFVGTAWYRREVEIPVAWVGKRIILTLERPHISSEAWLGDISTPIQTSLAAPHVHDFGINVAAGRHTLTLRISNRLPVDIGQNSSSVTDHTQTNWNGIIGTIALSATHPVWIEDVQVFSELEKSRMSLRVTIGNATGKPGTGTFRAQSKEREVSWDKEEGHIEMELPIAPDAKLWDEFHPVMHDMEIELRCAEAVETKTVRYGLREARAEGTQISLNGRKIFLRGTLECAVFPLTGYPPTQFEEWHRIFTICKAYGFNHVRFHSWCPPEAAFQAADELGFYLQVECSSWAYTEEGLGCGEPIDSWLYEEARAIIKAFGNHPSFLLMAYGNEPGGQYEKYLSEWVRYWREHEPRRLHTTAGGWPAVADNDFDNIPDPRLHLWAEGNTSRLNAMPPSTDFDHRVHVAASPRPIVSHEIGQWCVYPDFAEIPKYTGLLKPRNFEIFRDSLEANHLGDCAENFVKASGKLQVLCYREEVEASLRTPGLAGFQLLQANDFPGQGTALVGWLDPFWNTKGYTSPEEFRRFNAPIVLLARLPKRVFSTSEFFRAELEIAHFGEAPLKQAVVEWEIVDSAGKMCAEGEITCGDIPIGNGISLGNVHLSLTDWQVPQKYRLVARLRGLQVENDWEFWVYGIQNTVHLNFAVTPRVPIIRTNQDLDAATTQSGPLLLLVEGNGRMTSRIGLGFTPIFWNTSWTRGQLPHTLGLTCDPTHQVFASFPTESHTNWQWWELLHDANALVLDMLPSTLRPLVQVIDDWTSNHRLGLLFEARVGRASVMVCGMDIVGALPWRHTARQFRKSLDDYMTSDHFAPQVQITSDQLKAILSASLRPNADFQ